MPIKQRRRLAAFALPMVMAVAGCGPQESAGKATPGSALAIRVAGTEGVNSATPFFVARKLGYFRDAGLNVSYVTMSGGDMAMAAALNAGQIDVAIGSSTQWVSDAAKGVVAGKIIGQLTANNYVILARKGISDVRQLKGKLFAVSSLNAGDHLYSQAVLSHFGVAAGDVTWLAMGTPASRLAAMLAGKVDATEMTLTYLPPSAKGSVIVGADESPVQFAGNAFFARQRFLDMNKAALHKFLAAIGKGAQWAIAHPEEAVSACEESGTDAAGCKVAIDLAKASTSAYTWSPTTHVDRDVIAGMIPIVAGVVPQAKTLSVADIVDISVAEGK
jgi:ABC-type nitrate/sulfonate/bicarbonate transport system substrate-binding protein